MKSNKILEERAQGEEEEVKEEEESCRKEGDSVQKKSLEEDEEEDEADDEAADDDDGTATSDREAVRHTCICCSGLNLSHLYVFPSSGNSNTLTEEHWWLILTHLYLRFF